MRNEIHSPDDPGAPMALQRLDPRSSVSRRGARSGAWAYLICSIASAVCHAQGASAQRPTTDGAGAAKPPGEIVVKVLDLDGKPLAAVAIQAFNLGKPVGGTATERPIAPDEFRSLRPPPGRTRMVWFYHEDRKLAGAVTFSGDSMGPIIVKLLPWGVITGRVVDEKGRPREGLIAIAKSGGRTDPADVENNAVRREMVGRDGRFRLERIIPGLPYQTMIHDSAFSFGHWGPEFVLKAGETKDLAEVMVRVISPPTNAPAPSSVNLPVARLDETKSIDEYQIDFRQGEYDTRWLKMDAAPGTVKLVQPDKRGLRFTVPNGLGEGPAVATKFGVHGDFEITATFEVLSRVRPDVGYGMGPDMVIKPPGGWDKFASISRFIKPDDMVFSMVHKEKVGDKEKWNARLQPTQATSGRLRLVRVGPILHYQLAEGDSKTFREMFVSEYGAEDLEFVRISATTGGSKKPVDMLWKDLSVRAKGLPGWVGLDSKSKRTPPWITAVLVSAALLLGLMGLVWWLASSRGDGRRAADVDVGPEKQRPAVAIWDESSLREMETAAAAFAREKPEAATCLQRPRCRFSLRDGALHGPFTAWQPVDQQTLKGLGETWEEIRGQLPVLYEGTYQDGKRHGTFSYHDDQGQAVTRRFRNGRPVA
jgi:hypothetical protein